MQESSRYSVLFEPVAIGPVTARNRFYQVPHCDGLGHVRPRAEAAMRGVKAEGGWAVVSTQETEIHPSSDLSPYAEGRLWDDRDIPALRLMTDAVHDKGALAAIELVHNGPHALNHLSRAPVLAPSEMPVDTPFPRNARAMDKSDIRDLRRWHREAALRAREAGFDIVYVYAGHGMSVAQHFMLPHLNQRNDEYGGSLENRVRLTRELLEDAREAVGDSCAIAFRFAVDEMAGEDGMQAAEEGRAVVEMLAELPDLWDVNAGDWPNDSATTRFQPEDGYQNDYIRFVKETTSKPVVAVGRLTSPDQMVSMVKSGIVDFIGAARPSIADPFLPRKVEEGRIEDIRECIGCNICVASDMLNIPIRCTQNPTMGEEWRRGWHPEAISPKERETRALVVGAGPAGLECAMSLARRGYEVTLAEAKGAVGGRVVREAALPGLAAWSRVADHRKYQLEQMANVHTYLESELTAANVLELDVPNVFVATGSRWSATAPGRSTLRKPPRISPDARMLTPDDIMDDIEKGAGAVAERIGDSGPVLVYDDDQGYLAGVLAEALAAAGVETAFATPASLVSPFTILTLEQERVQRRLIELDVAIHCNRTLRAVSPGKVVLECAFTGREEALEAGIVVMVAGHERCTDLHDALEGKIAGALRLIGDAASPGLIADAVWSGHRAAREFERPAEEIAAQQHVRELVSLDHWEGG